MPTGTDSTLASSTVCHLAAFDARSSCPTLSSTRRPLRQSRDLGRSRRPGGDSGGPASPGPPAVVWCCAVSRPLSVATRGDAAESPACWSKQEVLILGFLRISTSRLTWACFVAAGRNLSQEIEVVVDSFLEDCRGLLDALLLWQVYSVSCSAT